MAEAAIETSALAHFQITRRKAMKVNRKGAERQLVVHRPASAKLRELSRLAQQISYCGDISSGKAGFEMTLQPGHLSLIWVHSEGGSAV